MDRPRFGARHRHAGHGLRLALGVGSRQWSRLPAATPKFVGFYWGTRGSDFKPRLGEATSSRRLCMDQGPRHRQRTRRRRSAAARQRRRRSTTAASATRRPLRRHDLSTSTSPASTRPAPARSAMATTPEDASITLPDDTAWTAPDADPASGAGFDASGVSHPSVVKDRRPATSSTTRAPTASGNHTIGRATSRASARSPRRRARRC